MSDATVPPHEPPAAVVETSMASSLRQFSREVSVGSLLARSFEVWWRNVLRFAALSLLVFLVVAVVVAIPLALAVPALGQQNAVLAIIPVALLAGFLVSGVYLGGLSYGAIQHLSGGPVRVGGMLRAGMRRIWPTSAAIFVSYLAIFGATLLLIVPGILVALGFSLVPAVAVAEKVRPMEALRRSWELSKGSRLTLFLAGLVLWVLLFSISMGSQLVLTLAISPVAGPLLSVVVQLLLTPLLYALPGVLYHDLRLAKEGVSTADLVAVFE